MPGLDACLPSEPEIMTSVRIVLARVLAAGLGACAAGAVVSATTVAAASPGLAVLCGQGVVVRMEPPGRIAVVEFKLREGTIPVYGRVFASMDAAAGVFNPVCKHVAARVRVRRPLGLAGPWPRAIESRVFCTAQKGALRLQINPVRSKGQKVGNRLLMWLRFRDDKLDVLVVDASLTRGGGGISYDPGHCDRNIWP
jgi:hypothetical protein